MNKFICLHGHFYQPPRWDVFSNSPIVEVPVDWNQKITEQCYGPNGRHFSKISFNFGPTLLSWMQAHAPHVYESILEADRQAQSQFDGHGSAIAQCYNHMIMPLASERDKHTQVIWGIEDFKHRFKREPEGMWLPETAVDVATLEVLAAHNIKFTVLAPTQALKVRYSPDTDWVDVSNEEIDSRKPYWCSLPSGKRIVLFFYNGMLAHQIAFGCALKSREGLFNELTNGFDQNDPTQELVHCATDGETYGHHHLKGVESLAYALDEVEHSDDLCLTVYGQYLEKNPPTWEVIIKEPSSWSCIHGVKRWSGGCSCRIDHTKHADLSWRKELRDEFDRLRVELDEAFEANMSSLSDDPWRERDEFIKVVLDPNLAETYPKEKLNSLLMQYYAMLMYTSCAWFFDEKDRLEPTMMRAYAQKAKDFLHA